MKNSTHKLKRILGLALLIGFAHSVSAQTLNGYRPFDSHNEFSNDTLNPTSSTDLSYQEGEFTSGWTFFPANPASGSPFVTLRTNANNTNIESINLYTKRPSNLTIDIYSERFYFISGTNQPISFKIRQQNASGGTLTLRISVVDDDGNAPDSLPNNLLRTLTYSSASQAFIADTILNPALTGIYRFKFSFEQEKSGGATSFIEFADLECQSLK